MDEADSRLNHHCPRIGSKGKPIEAPPGAATVPAFFGRDEPAGVRFEVFGPAYGLLANCAIDRPD